MSTIVRQQSVITLVETSTELPTTLSRDVAGLERWMVDNLATRLRVEGDTIETRTPISHLGLDSVEAMEIIGDIEETFHVTLDPEELVYEQPSIMEIAEKVSGLIDGVPMPRDHATASTAKRPSRVEPEPENETTHAFARYVNPYLGSMLSKLNLDKQFVRGEGSYLVDPEGRRYLDFVAQYGALPFGFNPPAIWDAVSAVRASSEPSFVQPSLLDAAGELARRLVDVTPPGLDVVTFSNSGTEAIEAAIKLSRAATGRPGILATTNSFHGKTLGALSATGNPDYQEPFGAPLPNFDSVPFGDVEALERALADTDGNYAAFIVEPIQGEGGIVEPPPGYLGRAQELCRRAGVLLVVDEIQTGLGRTGALFACESEGVTPDVMTLAKALGGGLVPIGATLCTEAAYTEAFAMKHSSTFAGNSLACRVGLKTLALLEEDDRALVQRVADNGARMKEELAALADRFPQVMRAVRGRGYLLGVQLSADRTTWPSSMLGYVAEQGLLAPLVASYLLNVEGVRTAPTLNGSDVLRIEPPLTATWDECSQFLAAFERTMSRLASGSTADFVGHLIGLEARDDATALEARSIESGHDSPRIEAAKDAGKFAFLMHPLGLDSYGHFDESLARLDRGHMLELRNRLIGEMKPMSVGETTIVSNDGSRADGEFIIVPYTAEELLTLPQPEVLSEIELAARSATERGARILGLGGFLSVVTGGGLYLKDKGLPAITTGNSYTVVAAEQAIRRAAEEIGLDRAKASVGVVGASGAIGRAAAMMLSKDFAHVALVGNPANAERSCRRLQEVAADIIHYLWRKGRETRFAPGTLAHRLQSLASTLPANTSRSEMIDAVRGSGIMDDAIVVTTDIDTWLPLADVVVTATSSVECLVRSDHLRERAIVCDLSRPSNVSPELRRSRPDVLAFEGGVVQVPKSPDLGCRFGLAPGHVYACMAETMILALEKRYRDTSMGLDLDVDTIDALETLSKKHGFRACGKPIE